MELIYKKDAVHAVLHNTGDAAVAAVQNIKPINPHSELREILIADAIERLTAEIDRKDKAIERMRDLMRHYKAAYRTAYKLYQEARNEQQP